MGCLFGDVKNRKKKLGDILLSLEYPKIYCVYFDIAEYY